MATKICYTCKEAKEVSNFRRNKRNRDGLNGSCRNCCRLYHIQHRINNLEVYREKYKRQNNSEKGIARRNKFQKTEKYKEIQIRYRNKPENKQKIHEYTTSQEYRDKQIAKRQANIEERRAKELIYNRERRKIPEVRIKSALRARLCTILKRSNGSKSGKMVELIGCTMPFLRAYLESLWKEGMSWNSYGYGRGHWVIDHVIPCDNFNLLDPEEQRKCFNYKNLQPLWWEENAVKSNKI